MEEISRYNFYPQYNDQRAYPLNKVIDIPRLNNLITDLGLNSQIEYSDKQYYYYRYNNVYNCISLLYEIRHQSQSHLNLGNVFYSTDGMFDTDHDPYIQNIYRILLTNIPFSEEINHIVENVKNSLKLKEYHSLHLRLEDDYMAMHLTADPNDADFAQKLYQKYKENMAKIIPIYDKIFVATNLGKTGNKNNFMLDELKRQYPNVVTSELWRLNYAQFPEGREFDAIIDYLICCGGKSYIGLGNSTFSRTIFFRCMYHQIPFLDCSDKYLGLSP